jgi:hypothetical protein
MGAIEETSKPGADEAHFASGLGADMMQRMQPSTGPQPHPSARHVHATLVPALEAADAIVYGLVGIVFLLAALGMLGYSLIAFPDGMHEAGFALAVVALVNTCCS